jgi:acyl carrier protein
MEKVIGILKKVRPEFEFAGVNDFFARGMLDSFDLTSLVSELEASYGIAIDGGDIIPENFRNLEAILGLVAKYKGVS